MRIAIYGAAGSIGTRVATEALSRGHTVTGIVRRESQIGLLPRGVIGRLGDATDAEEIANLSRDQDVVIGAPGLRLAANRISSKPPGHFSPALPRPAPVCF